MSVVAMHQTHAQRDTFWRVLDEASYPPAGRRYIQPERYSAYVVEGVALRSTLQNVAQQGAIRIPVPEGGFKSFHFWPNGLLSPELAEQYPEIRTFSGQAADDPAIKLRMEITPQGFRAMVMDPVAGDWFIDPYAFGDPGAIVVYRKKHYRRTHSAPSFSCTYDEVNDVEAEMQRTQQWIGSMGDLRVGDCQLRTYRLALACTGEYANFHGSTTANNDRSFALGAMVTTMDRVNAQFERDATLTMVLVPNTDQLIYLNPATDPYSNGNGGAMLGQNQTACNNVIGSANYDIGHVFSTGGGGVAFLNSPCNASTKAGGVTGQTIPVGDPFDIDYVAHEMGHQYGGNHTQNNSCNRASSAAFEPGSASTIMGYAGICVPNVQQNSDAYFHGHSMAEMAANITVGTSSSCPQTATTGNQAPTVNAGGNFTIPRSTPFVLTATGNDPDPGSALTYCWEQRNNQVSTQPPVATSTSGPSFRSFLPTSSPQRYFPSLAAVVANTTPTWEVLASVARTYAFRVTVRDNAPLFGCNVQGNVTVTVAGNAGPFLVTQPNTSVTWTSGSQRTITWSEAGTTASPVSCANVDILLSLDGGSTYPETLAVATANDGAHTVTLPVLPATVTTARVMVRGSGNIFYDISNTDFVITASPTPDYGLLLDETEASVCLPAVASFSIGTVSIAGYVQPIAFSVSGLPAGVQASFSNSPVTPGSSTVLTLSGLSTAGVGAYPFTLNATSPIGAKSENLLINVNAIPAPPALESPSNGAMNVVPGTLLDWQAVPDADTYQLQIASDAGFTNVIESASGLVATEYTPLLAIVGSSTYFWRARSTNECGTGAWSAERSFTTASCISVTVRITTDRYGEETTWQLVQGTTVFASGGPYTRLPSNGIQVQDPVVVCLPEGCYDLVVFDSFGDGNCCAYGQGIITAEDEQAQVIATVSNNTFTATQPAVESFCVSDGVRLNAKLWLDGALRGTNGPMAPDLASQGFVPLSEPYTELGFEQVVGGSESIAPALLQTTGSSAIVDWVRIELRSSSDATQVLATRQALLQSDGDIVDVDGISPVLLQVPQGSYFVAVRHRNHLGCMSAQPILFGSDIVLFDLQDPATATFGTDPRRVLNGTARLWNGNVVRDGRIAYTGQLNDRDPILSVVGGIVPTNTVAGYRVEDVNMDGLVKYTGQDNDRDPVLQAIGGIVPTSVRTEQLP